MIGGDFDVTLMNRLGRVGMAEKWLVEVEVKVEVEVGMVWVVCVMFVETVVVVVVACVLVFRSLDFFEKFWLKIFLVTNSVVLVLL